MTAVLERVEPVSPAPPPATHPSRLARWWSSWRLAIRLGRRDAWRGKGRALLVILLIALPVGVTSAVLVAQDAGNRVRSGTNQALLSLGSVADARVMVSQGPVSQSADLTRNGPDPTAVGPGLGHVPTRADLLAALPPGSRVVDTGVPASVVVESGEWGVQSNVLVADVRDPLNAGRWTVHEGRLPSTGREIALTPSDAARIRAHVGGELTVTTTSGTTEVVHLTLVGLVDPTSPWADGFTGVVLPGVLPADPAAATPVPQGPGADPAGTAQGPGQEYLVSTPDPLGWAEVRALNAIGAVVASRSVLQSPPPFCAVDVLCLDSGPAPVAADPNAPPTFVDPLQTEYLARQAALAGVGLVLVVLQVALLAGPAFAVQLRRRQRELGLVGASGGSAADLRRAVLASGVVLGVVGGVAGIALGWLAVALLGGPLPWTPLAESGVPLGVPPLPWYVVGVAAIGLVSAVVASLVPAVLAGRGDVVDALRGRRPLPALRTRTPVLGLLLGVAGVLLLLYGRHQSDPVILGVGIIVGELGLVLVMPWLVVQCGRVGRWLPLAPRLAVRDAGRHRLRTAAAACAIAAAAAAAVATSSWSTSTSFTNGASDVPYVQGTLPVQVYSDFTDPTVTPAYAAGLGGQARGVIDSVVPGSTTAMILGVMPRSALEHRVGSNGDTGTVECRSPYVGVPPVLQADPSVWDTCQGRMSTVGSLSGDVVLLQDPADLGTVLGPLVGADALAAARAELEAGGAVVLQPHAVGPDGRVSLAASTSLADGSPGPGTTVALPAVEVLTGALPASVVLGPKSLAPGSPAAAALAPDPWSQVLLVQPSQADRPDRPSVADRISIGLLKARIPGNAVSISYDSLDSEVVLLAVTAAATLLLALLAGLMVTALALVDGRSDLTTLAAVGAEPRVRRRIAASSAGFVSLLGCAAGVVSGLTVGWLLNSLFAPVSGASAFLVHWWLVAFVLVGIPLVTAGVAWLTTRSRIVLTRRGD